MVIKRHKHRTSFTVLPNRTIGDRDLSAEVLGVLTYLISKPAGWRVNVGDIMRRFGMGTDRAYRIMGVLVSSGYAERHKGRDKAGRFQHDYLISDTPHRQKPDTDEPGVDGPFVGNGSPIERTDLKKEQILQKPERRGRAGAADVGKATPGRLRDQIRQQMKEHSDDED